MALHDDLLEQAGHLAMRETKRPRQASLRRAVSAAYYALFHILAAESTQKLLPPHPGSLRVQARRAFVHKDMRELCRQVSRPRPAGTIASLLTVPIEPELRLVAEAFVTLQQARHEADYDLTATFNRVDVLQLVQRAHSAVANWRAIRSRPNATIFLAALLIQR
jgi:hypothetical protein